jgi:hypothetical protein
LDDLHSVIVNLSNSLVVVCLLVLSKAQQEVVKQGP